MWRISGSRTSLGWLLLATSTLLISLQTTARADSPERTSVNVVVKDAATDQPINQARLTLQFREPKGKLGMRRGKLLSFSAKTNLHGRYKFTDIPKGTVRLMVTAERHQSFGKEFEIEQDNQMIEVKLKPPKPLL